MSLHVNGISLRRNPTVNTRFRRIVTAIPAPESHRRDRASPAARAGIDGRHAAHSLGQRCKISSFETAYGNQWIDLSSGIVVANVGHAHPDILAAIRQAVGLRL